MNGNWEQGSNPSPTIKADLSDAMRRIEEAVRDREPVRVLEGVEDSLRLVMEVRGVRYCWPSVAISVAADHADVIGNLVMRAILTLREMNAYVTDVDWIELDAYSTHGGQFRTIFSREFPKSAAEPAVVEATEVKP